MAGKLKIDYIVEPNAAALAQRTAQQFVEVVEQAASRQGRARIAISGGSYSGEYLALSLPAGSATN